MVLTARPARSAMTYIAGGDYMMLCVVQWLTSYKADMKSQLLFMVLKLGLQEHALSTSTIGTSCLAHVCIQFQVPRSFRHGHCRSLASTEHSRLWVLNSLLLSSVFAIVSSTSPPGQLAIVLRSSARKLRNP